MQESRTEGARNKLARIYAIGIAAFIGIFGFITLLSYFLSHVK